MAGVGTCRSCGKRGVILDNGLCIQCDNANKLQQELLRKPKGDSDQGCLGCLLILGAIAIAVVAYFWWDNWGEEWWRLRPLWNATEERFEKEPPVFSTVKDMDGQVYRTVKIGTQTWMAQNLNRRVKDSWCYDDKEDNCAKYGRLYPWHAAMNLNAKYDSSSWNGKERMHQGICPEGWHIPSDKEWGVLRDFCGGIDIAGAFLKADAGWNDGGNGNNKSGFSALPAGGRNSDGDFNDVGEDADFWSATEDFTDIAYGRYLGYFYEGMGTHNDDKVDAFSVRCLKDSE
jgi:uncharacterized protein (TIGR02145 family)